MNFCKFCLLNKPKRYKPIEKQQMLCKNCYENIFTEQSTVDSPAVILPSSQAGGSIFPRFDRVMRELRSGGGAINQGGVSIPDRTLKTTSTSTEESGGGSHDDSIKKSKKSGSQGVLLRNPDFFKETNDSKGRSKRIKSTDTVGGGSVQPGRTFQQIMKRSTSTSTKKPQKSEGGALSQEIINPNQYKQMTEICLECGKKLKKQQQIFCNECLEK